MKIFHRRVMTFVVTAGLVAGGFVLGAPPASADVCAWYSGDKVACVPAPGMGHKTCFISYWVHEPCVSV